jgi:hypothetical protein
VLRFGANTLSVVLNFTLVVAILGYFGVQTTTFRQGCLNGLEPVAENKGVAVRKNRAFRQAVWTPCFHRAEPATSGA